MMDQTGGYVLLLLGILKSVAAARSCVRWGFFVSLVVMVVDKLNLGRSSLCI